MQSLGKVCSYMWLYLRDNCLWDAVCVCVCLAYILSLSLWTFFILVLSVPLVSENVNLRQETISKHHWIFSRKNSLILNRHWEKKHWLADERWKSVWHMVNLRKLGLLVQLILWDTRNVAVKSDNMTVNSYYYFVTWLIFNYRNTASE